MLLHVWIMERRLLQTQCVHLFNNMFLLDVPAHGCNLSTQRLRRKDHEFEVSLGYIARLSQNAQNAQSELKQKYVFSFVECLKVQLWPRDCMWSRTAVVATGHKLIHLIRHYEVWGFFINFHHIVLECES